VVAPCRAQKIIKGKIADYSEGKGQNGEGNREAQKPKANEAHWKWKDGPNGVILG
jgi:hypothetical protein